METPERKVKKKIIEYLKAHDICHEPREAGGFTYRKGRADLWLVYMGTHVEVEVKAPGGTMSPMQYKWADYCKQHGVPCYCVSSVEDLYNIFIAIDAAKR